MNEITGGYKTREAYLAYHRAYSKKHYQENKEQYDLRSKLNRPKYKQYMRQWGLKRREETKAFILAAKNRPCMDCKGVFPYWTMDFDHRDPAQKKFTIALYRNARNETLQQEINKCDVVCANCHRTRTQQRRLAA